MATQLPNGKIPISVRLPAHLHAFVMNSGPCGPTKNLTGLLEEAYTRHTALRADHASNRDPAVA
jgi:hypothetical protein